MTRDEDAPVRDLAWVALGLSDDAEARQRIIRPGDQTPRDKSAWIAAAALMRDPPRKVLKRLANRLDKQPTSERSQLGKYGGTVWNQLRHAESVSVRQMALWALRVHCPRGLHLVAERLVRESIDDVLVSQALMTMGVYRPLERESVELLRDVYLAPWEGPIPCTKRIWKEQNPHAGSAGSNSADERIWGIRTAAAQACARYELPMKDVHGQRMRDTLRSHFVDPPLYLSDSTSQSAKSVQRWTPIPYSNWPAPRNLSQFE